MELDKLSLISMAIFLIGIFDELYLKVQIKEFFVFGFVLSNFVNVEELANLRAWDDELNLFSHIIQLIEFWDIFYH